MKNPRRRWRFPQAKNPGRNTGFLLVWSPRGKLMLLLKNSRRMYLTILNRRTVVSLIFFALLTGSTLFSFYTSPCRSPNVTSIDSNGVGNQLKPPRSAPGVLSYSTAWSSNALGNPSYGGLAYSYVTWDNSGGQGTSYSSFYLCFVGVQGAGIYDFAFSNGISIGPLNTQGHSSIMFPTQGNHPGSMAFANDQLWVVDQNYGTGSWTGLDCYYFYSSYIWSPALETSVAIAHPHNLYMTSRGGDHGYPQIFVTADDYLWKYDSYYAWDTSNSHMTHYSIPGAR